MNINLTLLGEMITFAILVWVMMKYIWPPLMQAITERQQVIAEGLEAAERGQQELTSAKANRDDQLRQAKTQATAIIDKANQQANSVIEESKITAQKEREKILAQAKLDLIQEKNKAKYELQQQSVALIIATTEKILQQKIDPTTQKNLIDELISTI